MPTQSQTTGERQAQAKQRSEFDLAFERLDQAKIVYDRQEIMRYAHAYACETCAWERVDHQTPGLLRYIMAERINRIVDAKLISARTWGLDLDPETLKAKLRTPSMSQEAILSEVDASHLGHHVKLAYIQYMIRTKQAVKPEYFKENE